MFFVIIGVIFLGSFDKTFYIVSELLLFVIAYLFYDLSKNLKIKDMHFHLLFFSWLMAFFIFHSVFVIKNNRYFVLMAPPVAYHMILGLSEISNKMKLKIKNMNITFPVIAIVLTSIILLSTPSQITLI